MNSNGNRKNQRGYCRGTLIYEDHTQRIKMEALDSFRKDIWQTCEQTLRQRLDEREIGLIADVMRGQSENAFIKSEIKQIHQSIDELAFAMIQLDSMDLLNDLETALGEQMIQSVINIKAYNKELGNEYERK